MEETNSFVSNLVNYLKIHVLDDPVLKWEGALYFVLMFGNVIHYNQSIDHLRGI